MGREGFICPCQPSPLPKPYLFVPDYSIKAFLCPALLRMLMEIWHWPSLNISLSLFISSRVPPLNDSRRFWWGNRLIHIVSFRLICIQMMWHASLSFSWRLWRSSFVSLLRHRVGFQNRFYFRTSLIGGSKQWFWCDCHVLIHLSIHIFRWLGSCITSTEQDTTC